MKAKCNVCGFEADPDDFEAHVSPYHDLRCPKCKTSNIDTTELKLHIKDYGYGGHNTLQMRTIPAKEGVA